MSIVEGEGVTFTRGQDGVRPVDSMDPMLTAESIAPLEPGSPAEWRVQLAEERSDQVRLRVTCHGDEGEKPWAVSVSVDVPERPYDVAESIW